MSVRCTVEVAAGRVAPVPFVSRGRAVACVEVGEDGEVAVSGAPAVLRALAAAAAVAAADGAERLLAERAAAGSAASDG